MYTQETNKIKSYLGEKLYKELVNRKCFLAGGAVLGLLNGSEIKDFDIYCRQATDAIYLAEKIPSLTDKHKHKYSDSKSIVFGCGENKYTCEMNLIVLDYYDNLQSIFDSYDFTVCMGGFDFSKEEFGFGDRFFKDNMAKRVFYSTKSNYPLGALTRRLIKYQNKGFKVSDKEILKMTLDCMKLDLTDRDVLKDQLGGLYGLKVEELFPDDGDYSITDLIEKLNTMSEDINKKRFTYRNYDATKTFKDHVEWKKINDVRKILVDKKTGAFLSTEYLDDDTDIKDVEFPLTIHKYVRYDDVNKRYFSFFRNKFEYIKGETVTPQNTYDGLYGYLEGMSDYYKYAYKPDAVKIKLKVEKDDIMEVNAQHIRFKKAYVVNDTPVDPITLGQIDPMSLYQE